MLISGSAPPERLKAHMDPSPWNLVVASTPRLLPRQGGHTITHLPKGARDLSSHELSVPWVLGSPTPDHVAPSAKDVRLCNETVRQGEQRAFLRQDRRQQGAKHCQPMGFVCLADSPCDPAGSAWAPNGSTVALNPTLHARLARWIDPTATGPYAIDYSIDPS